jgi:hypothetical protein
MPRSYQTHAKRCADIATPGDENVCHSFSALAMRYVTDRWVMKIDSRPKTTFATTARHAGY